MSRQPAVGPVSSSDERVFRFTGQEEFRDRVYDYVNERKRSRRLVRSMRRAAGPLDGRTLGEANVLHRTGLNPIALRLPGESDFRYNLQPDIQLEHGGVLIVIGNPEQLARLRALCTSP